MSIATSFVGPDHRSLDSYSLNRAIDWPLLSVALILMVIGLAMVESSSISVAAVRHSDPFFFLKRQLMAVGLGVCGALFIIARVSTKMMERTSVLIFAGTVVALALVLIPGIGVEVNGARRWIRLGVMNLQVSELAKLSAALYVSGYLMRHGERLRSSFDAFIKPVVLIGLMGALCLKEPDYGSTVMIMAIAVGTIFLGGVRVWQFLVCLVLLVALGAFFIWTSEYRMNRVLDFFDPWANAYDGGFQLVQALIAVGSGSITGVGFGNSVQKLFYLPEAHTDFVFAVFAEEMGLIGVVVLISIYMFLVYRILNVALLAQRAGNGFGAFVSYGIAIWLSLQSLISMSVNLGLLPTKGLTLPMVSYGGSSMLSVCLALGVVMRVSLESRLSLPEEEDE